MYTRLFTAGTLLVALTLLASCGQDVSVEASAPTPAATTIAFDQAKAAAGANYYQQQCVVCHGADGLSRNFPAIKRSVYATPEAIAANKLANYTDANMPNGIGQPSDCVGECAVAIQQFFYKMWSQGEVVASSSEQSSSVAAITPADRTVRNYTASIDGELNAQSVANGKALYTSKSCIACHGTYGGYDGEVLTPRTATRAPIHNNLEYYVYNNERYDSLFQINHNAMPTTDPTLCEATCAEDVSAYIRSWTAATGEFVAPAASSAANTSSAAASSVVASSSAATISDAEKASRIAAGKALYENNPAVGNFCVVCHGNDGTSTGFKRINPYSGTYAQLVNIIKNGEGDMPACKPQDACAAPLADYIWAEFNGLTLTPGGGGTRP